MDNISDCKDTTLFPNSQIFIIIFLILFLRKRDISKKIEFDKFTFCKLHIFFVPLHS